MAKLTFTAIKVQATKAALRTKHDTTPAKLQLTLVGQEEPIYVPLFDKPVAIKAVAIEKALRNAEQPMEVELMHAVNDEGYDEYRIVAEPDAIAQSILAGF